MGHFLCSLEKAVLSKEKLCITASGKITELSSEFYTEQYFNHQILIKPILQSHCSVHSFYTCKLRHKEVAGDYIRRFLTQPRSFSFALAFTWLFVCYSILTRRGDVGGLSFLRQAIHWLRLLGLYLYYLRAGYLWVSLSSLVFMMFRMSLLPSLCLLSFGKIKRLTPVSEYHR